VNASVEGEQRKNANFLFGNIVFTIFFMLFCSKLQCLQRQMVMENGLPFFVLIKAVAQIGWAMHY
jgi:hypothetical protein